MSYFKKMKEKKVIQSVEDIRQMVDSFYGRVRADGLLGPIFDGIIQDRWPVHLEKMYRFWQTVLLAEHTYTGNPFAPHAFMPIGREHFERWVGIFKQNIDAQFIGEKAVEAKWRADKMAEMFQMKIAYYQNSNAHPIV